jgi:CBS domain-containing protein
MASPQERLENIANELRNGQDSERVTVRAFLSWFGVHRRGYYKVLRIREALKKVGLVTKPDFEGAYIDSEIEFAIVQHDPITGHLAGVFPPLGGSGSATLIGVETVSAVGTLSGTISTTIASPLLGGGVPDPTYRIGKLAAANRPPIWIVPDAPLGEAVTLMLLHDFSQLPVMQNERVVKGVISWRSIGSRLALGCGGDTVRQFIDTAVQISADESLFRAIGTIVDREYVLVRDSTQRISGIVTTSDLSLQFQQLAEPFLLLGEIENHVRRLIDGKFTRDDVRAVQDPGDDDRDVQSVADLTFGQYVRLLENPEMWEKVEIRIDRGAFVHQLDRVREIRNDVMHFDPDGVAPEELTTLREFVHFFQTLQSIGTS